MMNFFKRMLIYLFIFLFFVSLYKDLNSEITFDKQQESNIETGEINHKNTLVNKSEYKTVSVTVEQGDTLLSVMEKLNGNEIHLMDIKKILNDFVDLNPNINPYNLIPNATYLFPLYNE